MSAALESIDFARQSMTYLKLASYFATNVSYNSIECQCHVALVQWLHWLQPSLETFLRGQGQGQGQYTAFVNQLKPPL